MRHSPYRLLPVVVALLLVNASAALAREPEVQPNPEGVRAAAKGEPEFDKLHSSDYRTPPTRHA
jgi:hypothetical protein